MINSAAFPKVALSRPPIPWPRCAARCSVAFPIQEARGMIARPEKMKIKTSLCSGPQNRARNASGIKINSQFMQGAIVGWERVRWQVRAAGCSGWGELRGRMVRAATSSVFRVLLAWGEDSQAESGSVSLDFPEIWPIVGHRDRSLGGSSDSDRKLLLGTDCTERSAGNNSAQLRMKVTKTRTPASQPCRLKGE